MRRLATTIIFLSTIIYPLFSQIPTNTKPKLIVGIVVDQMRFDHLYRYQSKYGENGFNRLLREGYNFKNAHYNYIPTVTAAGHASIFTGATPAVHGVIGNSWFDRYKGEGVSNVGDDQERIVGSENENPQGVSPRNLLSTTISDQLRLSNQFQSKVISISLKDRGAILPGGHTANAAYWHDWQKSPGYFVSSSYYMEELPAWVERFNESALASKYLDTVWQTLYPIESYTESAADDNSYERVLRGKDSPTFPYDFKALRETYRALNAEYQMLWISPAGNSLLTDFAKASIENEQLGDDTVTDLLAISYSVPDVVGHTFGPQSVELQDIYLRLDQDIAGLLSHLDEKLGKNAYTVFLTADHGAIPVASYLYAHKLPTGIATIAAYEDTLGQYLQKKLGKGDWIQNFDGEQVYLNREAIDKTKFKLEDVQVLAANFLLSLEGISDALTAFQLQTQEYRNGMRHRLQNGFHPKRSGDILLNFKPGYIQNGNPDFKITDVKGTTHGSGYAYDTHVPIVWFGAGILHGSAVRKVNITDIAPTLAMLLNIQLPSGSTGTPMHELFEKPVSPSEY